MRYVKGVTRVKSMWRVVLFLICVSIYPALVAPSISLAHTTATCSPRDQSYCDSSQAVSGLGQRYMSALLQRRYDVMWGMLHPHVQAMWQNNEAVFATYYKARFHDFTLQRFTMGRVGERASWVNPETMVRYTQVEELPISLQLVPNVPPNQLQGLPQPDQHASQLFQNLPLIVKRVATPASTTESASWRILGGGPADLEAPILPPEKPMKRKIRVPILMYHYISTVPANDPNKPLRRSLSVAPSVFRRQLDYLRSQGYSTITLNQLFDALYYHAPLPSKPIVLTFDDGYEDAYTSAYPILKAHGYSGMFYIITGKVGWQGQMTWRQLREMLANGMQMGSLTIHHVNLGQMLQNSPAQAEQEVRLSQLDLQNHLGIPIQQFCYPYGEPFHHGSPALQQAAIALLAKNGYVGATTDPPPLGNIQSSQQPFMLLRTRVDGRESFQAFINSLSVVGT